MLLSDPYPLTHSWPLFEYRQHMDLGILLDEHPADGGMDDAVMLAALGIGQWDCDLADGTLSWSDGVYDLFGLPRGATLDRNDVVTLYAEPSRAVMERLRCHAIRHRRGFTLDAEIRPVGAPSRWMRLIAWPECVDGKAVRLRGLKREINRPDR